MSEENIVYFELNNWISGQDYPADEPFISWLKDDLNIKFDDEEWVKKNKLCVIFEWIDMSSNYCITATKDWVINNCPSLLTEYKQFIRTPDEGGKVYGYCGSEFLEYSENNFGITQNEEN